MSRGYTGDVEFVGSSPRFMISLPWVGGRFPVLGTIFFSCWAGQSKELFVNTNVCMPELHPECYHVMLVIVEAHRHHRWVGLLVASRFGNPLVPSGAMKTSH